MSVCQQVIQEKKAQPNATLKQIGDKCGVSGERVRQILQRAHIATHYHVKRYVCNHCCRIIDSKFYHSQTFCSPGCRKAYYTATVECEECRQLFEIGYRSLSRRVRRGQQHLFCSRTCKSRWLGEKYGFGVHRKIAPLLKRARLLNTIPQF